MKEMFEVETELIHLKELFEDPARVPARIERYLLNVQTLMRTMRSTTIFYKDINELSSQKYIEAYGNSDEAQPLIGDYLSAVLME